MKNLKVEKLDHLGRGISYIDNKITFINGALIDDIVDIKIIKEKKNYNEAVVENYTNKSNYRKPFCNNKHCGGCQIGELLYKKQLEYKEDKIKNIFNRYFKDDVKINNIVFCDDLYYRNKITLHVKNKKLGIYKNLSNEIVEIENCLIIDPVINGIIDRLRVFINNEENDITSIIIKHTKLNDTMLVFDGKVNKEKVLNYFEDVKSIFINNECLKEKYIKDKLGDYEFLLSKNSFYQVNRFNTENLYNIVLNNIKDKNINNVLDLYCGVGTIGIYVSKYAKHITGIEVIEDAIDSANKNKELNNVKNIDFICGKVEDNIDKFSNIDLIIVDPPRSGMDKNTIKNIIKINPKEIIYVSCDPMSLVRDLNNLKDNYQIKEVTPVDMFPNTYHVESVVILERK